MQPELSTNLIFLFVPAAFALALWAPPYVLLFAGVALAAVPGGWQLGGVHVDPTDLVIAGLALSLGVRPRAWGKPRRRPVPYLRGWVGLGMILSVAYLVAPINQEFFSSPVAVAYQLYRYCWRPILFYPLAVWLLRDRKSLEWAFVSIVLVADICSLQAWSQSFSGFEATGPFFSKNQLGGALITPCLIALSGTLYAEWRWGRRFYAVSLALIARGLLSASSRGAFMSVFAGGVFALCWLLRASYARSKIIRLAAAGMVLGLVVLAMKPDLLQRPAVQRLLTTSEGTDDENFKWRQEQRWPIFWQKVVDSPWLGTGTDTDFSLGTSANTPHNGYLAIAVVSGVPSLIIFVSFVILAISNGVLLFRRGKDRWETATGIAIGAAMVGLLVHNVVDQTFTIAFPATVFWVLVAVATAMARRPADYLPEGRVVPTKGTAARRAEPFPRRTARV